MGNEESYNLILNIHDALEAVRHKIMHVERLARLGACIEGLLQPGVTITFSQEPKHSTVPDVFTVNITGANIKRSVAGAEDLEAALDLLEIENYTRKCAGLCGLVKPLHEFSKLAKGPRGRNYVCKKCENARIKKHTQRRRGQQRGAGGDAPLPPPP